MIANVSPAFTMSPSFHSEFQNTSGHLTRYTILLDLHFTLYHFGVTPQSQETNECHDDYYC